MFPILLASASPRRRQLLEQVGFHVTTRPVDVDETPLDGEKPVPMARRLARSKADAAQAVPGEPNAPRLGLAADTVVWTDDGEVLGKPVDDDDARRMVGALSGRTHRVTTGYCVFDTERRCIVFDDEETTEVDFLPLAPSVVDAYVRSGEGRDKAGAYGIQGMGAVLVRGIRGSYPNVVGLPVSRLVGELVQRGLIESMPWEVPDGHRG